MPKLYGHLGLIDLLSSVLFGKRVGPFCYSIACSEFDIVYFPLNTVTTMNVFAGIFLFNLRDDFIPRN